MKNEDDKRVRSSRQATSAVGSIRDDPLGSHGKGARGRVGGASFPGRRVGANGPHDKARRQGHMEGAGGGVRWSGLFFSGAARTRTEAACWAAPNEGT